MRKFLARLVCMFVFPAKKRKKIRNRLLGRPEHPFKVGRHSYVNDGTFAISPDTEIGAFCSIGVDVILGPSQHPTDWLTTHPFPYQIDKKLPNVEYRQKTFASIRPVKIGADVWIGDRAIVMDGLTVGDGAIVAANAVVTKDVPAGEVWCGNPAQFVKKTDR